MGGAKLMLIVVEGCIGAGKSTVVNGLATVRGSGTLFEAFQSNPFLEAFYKDPTGNAIETEFAFLLLHYHQLKLNAPEHSRSEVICDFHLGKDLIYANTNLTDLDVRTLFHNLYHLFMRELSSPSLLIYLSATDDLIVNRIRQRNRTMEQEVDLAYFAKINRAYDDFFGAYNGKKLKLSMTEWDFVQNPTLFEDLSQMIDQELAER